MAQVVIEIRRGDVIVKSQGETKRISRGNNARFVINTTDDPLAEVADTEVWTPFERAVVYRDGETVEDADPLYRNSIYTVIVHSPNDKTKYLSIKANDRRWRHDWRHLQRIKNELCGPEWEAVELYPAESRLVDEANQFHLWCFDYRLPIGFTERLVSGAYGWSTGAKQRDLANGQAPDT